MTHPDDRARREAGLSPAKRALLARRREALRRGETAADAPAGPAGVERPAPGAAATGARPGLRRLEGPGPFPLSFGQERFWLLEQLEPGSAAHHVPYVSRLTGTLDLEAFRAAAQAVVDRHEIFRTTFRVDGDGVPVQVVAPSAVMHVPVHDLGRLPPGDRRAARDRLVDAAIRAPFDLKRGPLARVELLRHHDGLHEMVVCTHHIVNDGLGVQFVGREFGALYALAVRGQPPRLPDPPVQSKDWAAWQRETMSGARLDRELAWWRETLADLPPLDLPVDHPRRATTGAVGDRVRRDLPDELADGLRALARAERATLFMVLLAGFDVLLSRLTGRTDVVVGTPVAGRTRAELRELPGDFVNNLVLRTDLEGAPSFRDALARVRATSLAAQDHQEVPFELVLAALQPERRLDRSPLFQVMFDYVDFVRERDELPGLLVESEGTLLGTFYDLTLYAWVTPSGLALELEHDPERVEASTARRWLEGLETLLAAAVAAPETPVDRLPVVGPTHRAELGRWSRGPTSVRGPDGPRPVDPAATVARRFAATAARAPDAPALTEPDGRTHTYRDLDVASDRLAHRLRALGVGPEVLVGVCLERCTDVLVAVLGTWKAGGAYVPLEPTLPPDRLRLLLEDTRPAAICTHGNVARDVLAEVLDDAGPVVVALDEEADALARLPAGPVADRTSPGDLAYVIHTSGSTGRPKGVAVEQGALANHVAWVADTFGLGPGDRLLFRTPLGFDASVWELVHALVAGAELVVAPAGAHHDAGRLLDLAARERVTVLQTVPSLLRVWADEPAFAGLRGLRHLVCAGEALPASLVEAVDARRREAGLEFVLHNLYGPTEACIDSSSQVCTPAVAAGRDVLPVGRPATNVRLLLLDAHGQPVPAGAVGEVHVGGAGLARGYLGRPDLTAAAFVDDPTTPGERLYRTGDLGRWLHTGALEYVGRRDHQVKVAGHRIELGEVEAALERHPDVRQAVVTVQALGRGATPGDSTAARRLVGYVVPHPGRAPDGPTLRAFLARSLPAPMLPSAWVLLDELPLNTSEKVDRAALPAPGVDRPAQATPDAAPRDADEELLAGLFAQVLGLERVGVHDDFFALGGNSLQATRLVSRLRAARDVELPLRRLFEAPTVAGLAELLEAGAGTPPLRPVPRDGPLPLSFPQRRLVFLDRLDPGSPVYALPVALRLRGALDVPALQAALDGLVARHESLRTTFVDGPDGEPVQRIAPTGAMPLQAEDAPERLAGARDGSPCDGAGSALDARLRELARRPFDLASGPLVRAHLLRVASDEHVLLVVAHHVVTDGWSLGVAVQEVQALYRAARAHGPTRDLAAVAGLPPVALQAADVAAWQRARLSGPGLEREVAHWRGVLDGAPPALDLPTDRPRPPTQGREGRRLVRALPAALSDDVRALARDLGATLQDTLLAAYAVLLERLTGEQDLVVGTVAAGRTRLELEPVVGFLVNTLPLRVDLTGEPTFRELVARVHAAAADGLDHQHLPFEALVEALRPARDLSRAPVFQTAFGVDELPDAPPLLDDLEVEPVDVDPGTAKLDLNVTVETRDGVLTGALEYATDLFDEDTVARWWTHLVTLLRGAVDEPDAPVHALDALGDATRRALLALGTGPDTALPAPALVPGRFAAAAAATPDAPALWERGAWCTYGELAARVGRLADALRAHGVGREVLLGVAVPRSRAYLEAVLGTWAAGGAVLPLDVEQPVARQRALLEDAGVALLLTAGRPADALRDGPWAVLDVTGDAPPSGAPDVTAADPVRPGSVPDGRGRPPRAADLAYVLYTSGSTGRPKGVEVTHGALADEFAWYVAQLGVTCADRFIARIPTHFDAGLLEWIPPLVSGASLVLVPSEDSGDPGAVAELTAAHDVTVVHDPPPLLEALLREPRLADARAVRHVTTGGDLLDERLLHRAMEVLPGAATALTLYGPTEACVDVTCRAWTRAELGRSPAAPRTAPIGRPHDRTRLLVVDRRDRLAPPGVPGELLVSGPCLARGYRGRPDETARAFTAAPSVGVSGEDSPPDVDGAGASPSARVYRTGDLARWRSDGDLEFLGRVDDQLKVAGQRIEPGEVEAALLAHPAVHDAHVAARADRSALVAWAGVRDGPVDGAALRAWLAERLPAGMVPARVVVLDAIPRRATGKVDRGALPAPDELAARVDRAPPRTSTEAAVLDVVAGVLDRDASGLGVHDDFFASGGSSLLALRLVARLEEALGVAPALRALFERPTPAGIAAVVDRMHAGETALGDDAPDLVDEARLDDDLVPADDRADDPPRHVLLTGATGFLGAHVLAELLARSDADVHVLVRATDEAAGRARVLATLGRYALDCGAIGSRVHIVPGDLAAPRFGLGQERFDELACTLDAVVHSAASVDFFRGYRALAPANVGGTREAIRLACRGRAKPLHHVSTIGVLPFAAPGDVDVVREDDPLPPPDGLLGGYEQSKWVAERLVREAAARGLPVTIHRPGRVAGSATTGRSNADDLASRVFLGCVRMGAVPDLPGSLDVTPVDYCAAALVHLALHGPADGRVYHLVNPVRPRMQDAYDVAASRGHPVRRLPWSEWYAAFVARVRADPDDPLAALLPLLPPGPDGAPPPESAFLPDATMPPLDTTHVTEGLAGSGIACPVVDARLIGRWMDAWSG